MISIFQEMIETAKKIGVVTDANMYDFDYLNVSGKTADGAMFALSLSITKEGQKDGN